MAAPAGRRCHRGRPWWRPEPPSRWPATGRMDAHGMIAIAALHDAASDRPVRYTPACSRTAIPVCLKPRLRGATCRPWRGRSVACSARSRACRARRRASARPAHDLPAGPPATRLAWAWPDHWSAARRRCSACCFPDQIPGPVMTGGELAAAIRSDTGPAILASLTGDGPGASPAQRAVHDGADDGRRGCGRTSRRGTGPPAYEAPPVAAPAPRPAPRPGGSPACPHRPGAPG